MTGALLSAQLRTPETRQMAIGVVRRALRAAGGSQAAAALELGVGHRTLKRWLADDAELRAACERYIRPVGRNRRAAG